MVKLPGVRLMNDDPVSANVQILSDLAPSLASQFRPLDLLERWGTIGQARGPILTDRLSSSPERTQHAHGCV
jgi:hypothetical protein